MNDKLFWKLYIAWFAVLVVLGWLSIKNLESPFWYFAPDVWVVAFIALVMAVSKTPIKRIGKLLIAWYAVFSVLDWVSIKNPESSFWYFAPYIWIVALIALVMTADKTPIKRIVNRKERKYDDCNAKI